MGMFFEIAAEHTAKQIETILIEAINTNNKEIFEFAKKHLYPFYIDEIGEAWKTPNHDIVLKFKSEVK